MKNIFKRMWSLFIGGVNQQVDKLESKNIDILIANVLEERKKVQSQIKDKILQITVSHCEMEEKLEASTKRLKVLHAKTMDAINKNDDRKSEYALNHEQESVNNKSLAKAVEDIKTALNNLYADYEKIDNVYETKINNLKTKNTKLKINEEISKINDIANLSGEVNIMSQINDVDEILSKKEIKIEATEIVNERLGDSLDDELELSGINLDKDAALENFIKQNSGVNDNA